MTYRTTTTYGTWCSVVNDLESSPEEGINAYLGDADGDEYDMEGIYHAYRDAIEQALPPSVSLCGNEFIGPAYPEADEFDSYPEDEDGGLCIKDIVEDLDIDMGDLFEAYELYTLERIGTWVLNSKAKDPAKAAAAALSRLQLKAFDYRPHPESGRPQARYRVGDVREALAKRPGQGKRTDLQDSQ